MLFRSTSTAGGSGMTGTISTPGLTYGSAQGNAFTPSGIHKFAQGGAFTNGIYTSPTYFKFANGGSFANGVMGEKPGSPGEAVMPLGRTSTGDLGVKVASSGTSSSSGVVINITTNVTSDGSASSSTTSSSDNQSAKSLADGLNTKVKSIIVEEMRPNGLLAKFAASR